MELLGPDRNLPVSNAQGTARAWDTPGVHQHLPLLPSPLASQPIPPGIPPLYPCQGDQGRCGSSAWPVDEGGLGMRGPQHLFGQVASGSDPAALAPTPDVLPSTDGSRGQQHPGPPVSIICSSLPGFLCQQRGPAQGAAAAGAVGVLPPREGSCSPRGPGEPGSSGGCRPRVPWALHHNWICICPAFYCMEIEL